MLRWLPSALYNRSTERQHFLQDILLFVLGAHILLFLVMMGASMFGNKPDRYSISMHQTGATYVLMPLHKKIDQPQKQSLSHSNSINKKSQVVNYEDYEQRKNKRSAGQRSHNSSKNSSKDVIASKKVAKTQSKDTRNDTLKKVMQQDRATAALIDDRKRPVVVQKVAKKGRQDRNKKSKQSAVKVQEIETVVVQPVASSKIEEQIVKTEAIIPSVVQEVQAVDTVDSVDLSDDKNSSTDKNSAESFDVDNVIFVGYQQLDECVIGSKIQHSIQQCWTPPIGVTPTTSCQMRVTISDEGVACMVKIEKSSGVLVYDTSARLALLQVEYPKEVYGKTITIDLGN